jgi:hypothetical protein
MTKQIIQVNGFPVKMYVSADNKTAHVFPLFGRYYTLRSDENVMDFATTFLLARNGNVVSFQSYQMRDEETAIIQIAA